MHVDSVVVRANLQRPSTVARRFESEGFGLLVTVGVASPIEGSDVFAADSLVFAMSSWIGSSTSIFFE